MKRICAEQVKLMKRQKCVLENTNEDREYNGFNYGSFELELSKTDIKNLTKDKCLAFNLDGEYVLFVTNKGDIKYEN